MYNVASWCGQYIKNTYNIRIIHHRATTVSIYCYRLIAGGPPWHRALLIFRSSSLLVIAMLFPLFLPLEVLQLLSCVMPLAALLFLSSIHSTQPKVSSCRAAQLRFVRFSLKFCETFTYCIKCIESLCFDMLNITGNKITNLNIQTNRVTWM